MLFEGANILGIPSSVNLDEWAPETAVHYTMFFNIFVFL